MIPAPVTLATAPEVESPKLVAAVSSNSVSRVEPELPTIKHIVAEADTFWSIAQRYGVSPEAIANLNNLSVNSILSVGQSLKIPTPMSEPIARYEVDAMVIAPTAQRQTPQSSVEVAALNGPNKTLMEGSFSRPAADIDALTLRGEQAKLIESIQTIKSQPTQTVEFEAQPDASAAQTLISSTVLSNDEPVSAPKEGVVIPVPQPKEYAAPAPKAEPPTQTLVANNAISSANRLPEPPRVQGVAPELVIEATKPEKNTETFSIRHTVCSNGPKQRFDADGSPGG